MIFKLKFNQFSIKNTDTVYNFETLQNVSDSLISTW